MEDMLKELTGKIDHKTYMRLTDILFYLSYMSLPFTLYSIGDIPLFTIAETAFLGGMTLRTMMRLGKLQYYTKDVNEIREVYNEFIRNYSKLNKVFDLSDPYEIFLMYKYLLYKGYLSKEHKYDYHEMDFKEIAGILGLSIINGYGVCRNNSAMLRDILKESGITAHTINGDLHHYNALEYFRNDEETREFVLKSLDFIDLPEETKIKMFEEILEENMEKEEEISTSQKILNNVVGNHVITYAFKNGTKYFLDPMQKCYYTSEDNRFMSNSEKSFKVSEFGNRIFAFEDDYKRKFVDLDKRAKNMTKELAKLAEEKIDSICNENNDIFEQFHSNNREIFEEISEKTGKIRSISI